MEQARQSQRETVTGESQYFQGRRYLPYVIEVAKSPSVRLAGHNTMELRVRPGSDRQAREAVLQGWYRRGLREQATTLLAKWGPKIGVTVSEVGLCRFCDGTPAEPTPLQPKFPRLSRCSI